MQRSTPTPEYLLRMLPVLRQCRNSVVLRPPWTCPLADEQGLGFVQVWQPACNYEVSIGKRGNTQ